MVQQSSADTVTITDVHFPSQGIGRLLRYCAIVPRSGGKFPVLYFLHGANSGPDEVIRLSELQKLAVKSQLIIVIPDGEFSYYTNAKHKRNEHWEDAIAHELPRDVESRFPVLTGRVHTGIAGISMGGYGAVKLALKHSDQYSFVGDLSGALDITRRPASLRRWGQTWRIWSIFGFERDNRNDEDVFSLLDRLPASDHFTWFLACGKDDPLHTVNARFAGLLRRQQQAVNFKTTTGGHDWNSWNATLPILLESAAARLK